MKISRHNPSPFPEEGNHILNLSKPFIFQEYILEGMAVGACGSGFGGKY
jgi:hypothetical protein